MDGKTESQVTGQIPWWRRAAKRYGLDALSAMGLGLFSTLIVGVIAEQLSKIPGLGVLAEFANVAKHELVVGAGIGAAIAWGLKVAPLAIFASAVTGAMGNMNGVGPLGA